MRSDQPLQLVDVRESQELALASFPADVVHLPLSGSGDWLDSLREKLSAGVPVVVLCHAGIRSLHFGQWLLEQEWGWEWDLLWLIKWVNLLQLLLNPALNHKKVHHLHFLSQVPFM